MKPNLFFGIDVGISNSVVSYWNVRQNCIARFKLHGEELIPFGYFPENLEIPQGVDVLESPGIITNFMIDFWKSNQPSVEVKQRLQGWLTRLYLTLEKELPLHDAAFCFTYPLQRNHLEPLYRDLVIRSGFPEDRLIFLDELTATVYGHLVEDKKSPIGKGLIIDVEAGITNYTIVEILGGEAGMAVLDTSSIDVAGNACTRKLRLLLPDEQRTIFDKFVKDKPQRADYYKNAISSYYNDGNEDDISFRVRELGIKLNSESRTQFEESVSEEWESISRGITSRLKATQTSDKDLKFVVLTGNGSLHPGLHSPLLTRFGNKVIPTLHPEFIVSHGAAYFGRSWFAPEQSGKGGNDSKANLSLVSHVQDHIAYIEFPEHTKQKEEAINLLRTGQVNTIKQSLSESEPVSLKSNQVLISYSGKDETIAHQICQHLEKRSINCWISSRNLQPGSTWAGGIMKAIKSSEIFILVLTNNSNHSKQVMREVERAVNLELPIICIWLEELILSDELEYFISSIHWIKAYDKPLSTVLENLHQVIDSLLSSNSKSIASKGESKPESRLKEDNTQQLGPKEPPSTGVRLFIFYARRDKSFKNELVTHLAGMRRKGIIADWNDRQILPGQDWDQEIKARLENSQIVLFLISSDFLNSDYIHDVEIARIMEKHEKGKVTIVPVVIRPCDFSILEISQFQALPLATGEGLKPVSRWDNRDEAWLNVVNGLKRIISP